jgi:hypothetical protein
LKITKTLDFRGDNSEEFVSPSIRASTAMRSRVLHAPDCGKGRRRQDRSSPDPEDVSIPLSHVEQAPHFLPAPRRPLLAKASLEKT